MELVRQQRISQFASAAHMADGLASGRTTMASVPFGGAGRLYSDTTAGGGGGGGAGDLRPRISDMEAGFYFFLAPGFIGVGTATAALGWKVAGEGWSMGFFGETEAPVVSAIAGLIVAAAGLSLVALGNLTQASGQGMIRNAFNRRRDPLAFEEWGDAAAHG